MFGAPNWEVIRCPICDAGEADSHELGRVQSCHLPVPNLLCSSASTCTDHQQAVMTWAKCNDPVFALAVYDPAH